MTAICPYDYAKSGIETKFILVCPKGGLSDLELNVLNNKHNKYLLCDSYLEIAGGRRKVEDHYAKHDEPMPIAIDRRRAKNDLKYILEHNLRYHVFAYLGKSQYGVGVFALRDIPANTYIFDNTLGQCVNYESVSFSKKDIEKIFSPMGQNQTNVMFDYLKNFYLSANKNDISLPINLLGPNMIDLSFFLNHSSQPNVSVQYPDDCDMSAYRSKMNIPAGTELTINYHDFHLPQPVLYKFMPFLFQEPQTVQMQNAGKKKKTHVVNRRR